MTENPPTKLQLQVMGTCECGSLLQTTFLHVVPNPNLLGLGTQAALLEAQITCGRCQRTYRYVAQEEP